jgi:hypothetical protein
VIKVGVSARPNRKMYPSLKIESWRASAVNLWVHTRINHIFQTFTYVRNLILNLRHLADILLKKQTLAEL